MKSGLMVRSTGMVLLGLCFMFGAGPAPVSAGQADCSEAARNLPPLEVIQDDESRLITLCDAYEFHGNACPGATMAFMALRYGLELLYDDQVPDVDDLVILTRAPGGPMDLFDLVMKGNDPSGRTWPPSNMVGSADNFVFQFIRKSTMQTVTFGLRDGLWPEDWFDLREKYRDGTISEDEAEKRQHDRQMVLADFPGKSFEELFGEPEVHTFVSWGHMKPGELDRLMREQRRQEREQQEVEL